MFPIPFNFPFIRKDGSRTTIGEAMGGGGSEVDITPTLESGTKIADYEINDVSGSLYAPAGSQPVLLWQNLEPYEYTGELSITLSNGNYNYLLIECADNASNPTEKTMCCIIGKTTKAILSCFQVLPTTYYVECLTRDITFTDATHMNISKCRRHNILISGDDTYADLSGRLVPIRIYSITVSNS